MGSTYQLRSFPVTDGSRPSVASYTKFVAIFSARHQSYRVTSVAYFILFLGYKGHMQGATGAALAMTKTYSLYEAATGLFTGKRLHCDDEGLLSVRLPAGTLALEGTFDHRCQRLDLETGSVVGYRPAPPSGDHEWNSAERRWQVKALHAVENRTAVIYARINTLEATQGRAVREATLGDPAAIKRLKEIDAEIKDLRKELSRA